MYRFEREFGRAFAKDGGSLREKLAALIDTRWPASDDGPWTERFGRAATRRALRGFAGVGCWALGRLGAGLARLDLGDMSIEVNGQRVRVGEIQRRYRDYRDGHGGDL